MALEILFNTLLCMSGLLLVILFLAFRHSAGVSGRETVTVVVLGDFGRSPRMQYHAISLLKRSLRVNIVAYLDTPPLYELQSNERTSLHKVTPQPPFRTGVKLLDYVIKTLWLMWSLTRALLQTDVSSHIIVQNPPSIPSLLVAWIVSAYRHSTLVVDWHNYGHTILSLSLSANHPLVTFSKWYERIMGKLSHVNLCVTEAMKKDLLQNWGIRAYVLYDRPPAQFRPYEEETILALFKKLSHKYEAFNSLLDTEGGARPAFIVSSTSWTEDEDFGILLSALQEYERLADGSLPKLVCAITGKGPMKEHYTSMVASQEWHRVSIVTPWLEAEDYPVLLAGADLGICLHMSSSGLDLPMKVVDMFGCGLPVCAIRFNCLHELVEDNVNGRVFDTSDQLTSQLLDLLAGFPHDKPLLNQYRTNLETFRALRWDENWENVVWPLLRSSAA